jgi:hypothetical protein
VCNADPATGAASPEVIPRRSQCDVTQRKPAPRTVALPIFATALIATAAGGGLLLLAGLCVGAIVHLRRQTTRLPRTGRTKPRRAPAVKQRQLPAAPEAPQIGTLSTRADVAVKPGAQDLDPLLKPTTE